MIDKAIEIGAKIYGSVSGGKDGSYVAYMLKHKYGMNPLAVTVRPALSLPIGDQNLYNFIHSGYDHIHLSPNPKVLDRLNKYGFIEKGFHIMVG